MVSPSITGFGFDLKVSSLKVERILRQQKEARIAAAAELERLQKERVQARQIVLKPLDPEKASLTSQETKLSTPTLIPPTTTDALSSTFARQLQNIKRKTGLGSNQSHPPAVPEKKPQPGLTSQTRPPAVPFVSKSSPEQPLVNDEYTMNKQYLLAAERIQAQSRSQKIDTSASSDDEVGGTPGGFRSPTSAVGNSGSRGINAKPTPLSNICWS